MFSCLQRNRKQNDISYQTSPERPTLRITDGEASGSGGARGGGGGGAGAFRPVINAQEKIFKDFYWDI